MISVRAGDKLDHFQIERLVARSGMASIFQGTDLNTGQTVAIKIPHPEMECDPIYFERFQREEEIGKKLDHPGVMKVFPNDDRSDLYIVMEWVHGKLLREIMATTGKMPPQRAIGLVVKICRALDHIHSHGVVHRDLKPENIMVDENDSIKIIDFGISANTGARRITFAKLTETMGTPDYISPEQVKGGRGDARSDVYAVGVMLYEMLTGKTPFHADTMMATIFRRTQEKARPPVELDPAIPQQINDVVVKCLATEPEERFQSAGEILVALGRQSTTGLGTSLPGATGFPAAGVNAGTGGTASGTAATMATAAIATAMMGTATSMAPSRPLATRRKRSRRARLDAAGPHRSARTPGPPRRWLRRLHERLHGRPCQLQDARQARHRTIAPQTTAPGQQKKPLPRQSSESAQQFRHPPGLCKEYRSAPNIASPRGASRSGFSAACRAVPSRKNIRAPRPASRRGSSARCDEPA